MTTVIKHHHTPTHYITLEAEGARLIVQACPLLGDNRCGYPESECTYHYTDRKNANATFRRYIKKYTEV
jgi:hypothetical protein